MIHRSAPGTDTCTFLRVVARVCVPQHFFHNILSGVLVFSRDPTSSFLPSSSLPPPPSLHPTTFLPPSLPSYYPPTTSLPHCHPPPYHVPTTSLPPSLPSYHPPIISPTTLPPSHPCQDPWSPNGLPHFQRQRLWVGAQLVEGLVFNLTWSHSITRLASLYY